MNFKKTVAGISAAAIAVTQVAAVIPMGAFAASEQPVESNIGFTLKLTSKDGDTYSYDRVYLSDNDTKVVLGADNISASGENTDLMLSYGGLILASDTVESGDKYTFTADGLKIVANEKDKPAKDVTTTVLEGPRLLHNDKINVENAGDADDVVTITYTKGDSDINVVDSNGANINSDTNTDGVFTFTLTDDSASKFTILGGIEVTKVEVTKTKTTELADIDFDNTESSEIVTIPEGAVIGDKNTVVVSYSPLESGPDCPGSGVSVSGNGVSNTNADDETLTFDIDSSVSEFTLTGINSICYVELKSSKTTDLKISGDIGDPFTVSGDKFASAKVGDKIRVSGGEDISVRSGEKELAHTNGDITIDADNIDSIKTNGIALTASGITLSGVYLISKSEPVEGKEVVLFRSNDPVVWSQTWTSGTDGGYWSDDQSVSTSEISDKIGTIAAFKENYENITASWDSLKATKFVLDEGELWAGEKKIKYTADISIGKSAVKKGGKIIVEYKNSNADSDEKPLIILFKSDRFQFSGAFASDVTGTNGSVEFVLDEEAAEEISTNGFIVAGYVFENNSSLTITSVKYEAPVEKKIDINTKNFTDTNFQNVLKTFSSDGKTLSESDIEKITSLDSSITEQAALKKVKNFKGIENLTALRSLSISDNTSITAIDLSQNEKFSIITAKNCTKLANLKLPDSMETIIIPKAAITEFKTNSFVNLDNLDVSGTKITALDVSANTNLYQLNLSDTKVSELDLKANKTLGVLEAANCKLTKLDLSANTELEELDVSGNQLVSLDLSKLTKLTAEGFNADNNVRNIGEVVDGKYYLSELNDDGFKPKNMTIKTEGVTLGETLTYRKYLTGVTGNVEYTYDTGSTKAGLENVKFTLAPEKIIEGNFYVADGSKAEPEYTVYENWNDVLKAMNDKNVNYIVEIAKDVSVDKLTFPTAAKAKSVTVMNSDDSKKVTITTKSSSVTLPTNVTIVNVNIAAVDNNGKQAKNFTLSASNNLTVGKFSVKADKAVIKGAAKSVLTLYDDCCTEITGFGTVNVTNGYEVTFDRAVKAKDLKIGEGSTAVFGGSGATFTNIVSAENGAIKYNTSDYKPVSVTGDITGTVNVGIEYTEYGDPKPDESGPEITDVTTFNLDDVVLVSKTANLANINVKNSIPAENNYTLGRVGSDIKVMEAAFTMNDVKYAQWSDALSVIAANAKADKANKVNATRGYNVVISDTLNMNGAFKMPAAGTFDTILFRSETSEMPTIKFTGNITLAGNTIFDSVKLDSVKNVKGNETSADFSISAGKYSLQISNVKSGANIKSITSNGMVALNDVTVSSINAANINIYPSRYYGTDSYGALADENWEGKAIKNSSVTVTGNLTAKNELDLMGSLAVKGVLNAARVYSYDPYATLVVYKQANGKNALVIGKNGISNSSRQIKFVLADPEKNETAHITENIVLGTIAGPYADQFVPSEDNLEPTDDYRIIKDSNKLIAVPKQTSENKEYLVKVTVNGKAAYYKSLDEAIKDISATGRSYDEVVITVTQDMFKNSVAKLPLPTAGKYKTLTYTAESDVTINVTSDLTLTGNLSFNENVTLNKVDKSGNIVPISVNVGKYSLSSMSALSAKTTDSNTDVVAKTVSQFANISGSGEFVAYKDAEVAGRVNGVTLVLNGNTVTLGDRAVFNASVDTQEVSTLAYTVAKNVKFVSVTGEGLNIAGTFAENDTVASITGDYTKDAVIIDGELKVVRSGNTLKAVKAENVVEVKALANSGGYEIIVRTYDSLTSAVNDISRIKDAELVYFVPVKNGDVITLPKAKTYLGIVFTSEEAVTVTTAKDLTLTGNLAFDPNVTVKKSDGKAININLGNYYFELRGKIAPDENGVSQFNNVNGKGTFDVKGKAKVNGKLNVGKAYLNELELGSKSAFSAPVIRSAINTSNDDVSVVTLKYPLSIAKNVKLGNIGENSGLSLIIDGVKAGDQIAVLTGDFYYGTVMLNGFDPTEDEGGLVAVRSGSKLMATTKENFYFVYYSADSDNGEEGSSKYIVYYSYADVIADINRINNSDGIYVLGLPENATITKLTLPAKNKYNTFGIIAMDDDVTLKLTSDVALTGNLYIGKGIILQKKDGGEKDILKFTSPKDKDKKPIYTVTAADGGVIVNGTLNGEKIDSPEKPVVENVTLPYTNKDGFDLSNGSKLKIATADVEAGGIITITTAEEVPASSIKFLLADSGNGLELTHKSGTNTYTYTIVLDYKSTIKSSGFSVSGSEGKVTSITYTAPSIVDIKLPYNNADGIDLSANKIRFDIENAEDNGIITITTAEEVPVSSITLSKTSSTLTFILTHESGTNTYTYTIPKDYAELITKDSLTVSGSEGKVTGISYADPAPAPETTPVTELPWNGSVEFDSEGSGKTLEVAKGLLEAGKDDEDTTTVTITFTGNGDSSALTITDNAGNKLGEATSLSGSSAAIKLTKTQAQTCFSEGFKIKGTSVTVTGVSFKLNTNATPALPPF